MALTRRESATCYTCIGFFVVVCDDTSSAVLLSYVLHMCVRKW